MTVLASSFQGTRLTGPNDVIVKSDGSIWFSDNGAGIRGNYMGDKAPKEMPYRVYRLDPASGALTIAVGDMERPNGLCFSPDEKRLYVVDTPDGTRTTHVYDMVDGKAVNGRLFFDGTPGFADGIRCDTEGNVWCGFSGGQGQDGVADIRAGRHADRPHPAARALRQPLLRRPQAQPPVHDRQPVGLCPLCRGPGRCRRLNRARATCLGKGIAEAGCKKNGAAKSCCATDLANTRSMKSPRCGRKASSIARRQSFGTRFAQPTVLSWWLGFRLGFRGLVQELPPEREKSAQDTAG